MTTTKQAAQAIRDELKALGWGPRAVSVKSDSYSLGSTIRVTVRSATVSLSVVREIARRGESVRRDEATGEILGGGNRFVDVEYSAEALAPLRAELDELLSIVEDAPGTPVTVAGITAFKCPSDRYVWRAVSDAFESPSGLVCHGRGVLAQQLAEHITDERARLAMRPAQLSETECAETLPVPGLAQVVRLRRAS